jgi:hypothetical protein
MKERGMKINLSRKEKKFLFVGFVMTMTYMLGIFLGIIIAGKIIEAQKPQEKQPKQITESLEIGLFVDFCKEKGYSETSIHMVNENIEFVCCAVEKDEWRKSGCFSREEFEKWLK